MSIEATAEAFENLMDDDGHFIDPTDVQEAPEEPVEEVLEDEATEVEGDEDEAPEDDPEAPEEGEPQEPEEEWIPVTINGEEYEVTKDELVSGYLRNEQYTQRLNELDTEHQNRLSLVEQREIALDRELESLQLITGSELQQFSQINWQELRQEDPDRFKELKIQEMEARDRYSQTQARRQQLQALHDQAQQIKMQSYLREQEAKLMQIMPEIANADFRADLIAYGKEVGLSQEEIEGITDARHLLLLNQARLYAKSLVRKQEALEKKVPKDLPAAVKPGTPKPANRESQKALQAQRAQLKKSGSVRDAAALMMNYL